MVKFEQLNRLEDLSDLKKGNKVLIIYRNPRTSIYFSMQGEVSGFDGTWLRLKGYDPIHFSNQDSWEFYKIIRNFKKL